MDEPCSALDPRATLQIEELMAELKARYTIVIVTHNMQQAARASRPDGVPDDGRRPRRLRRRAGADDGDLHEPQEPTDRGLRLRSVRLSGTGAGDQTTDHDRSTTDSDQRQVGEILDQADKVEPHDGRRAPSRPRDARPGAARRSRTTSCGWEASSRRRSARRSGPRRPRCRSARSRSSRATAGSTRCSGPSAR